MAVLFRASALAPPESDFFCVLASAFRSNKKELAEVLSRALLVVCGKVGVCATVPGTQVFFLSDRWGNCCPEKSSHFPRITELPQWRRLAHTQVAAPGVQAPFGAAGGGFVSQSPASLGSVSSWRGNCLPREWGCSSHRAGQAVPGSLGSCSSLSYQDPWAGSLKD